MSDLMLNLISLLARYVHIVCSTLLVGGTLFYEMVVPVAIEDLKSEHQLEVMGRSRWVFRWIVWISAAVIVLSGFVQAWSHWDAYTRGEYEPMPRIAGTTQPVLTLARPPSQRPGWWWAAHASSGMLAALIAVFLTSGRRPPERPVQWMRLNLVILMIVMFLATATFHVRLIFQRSLIKSLESSGRIVPTRIQD